MKKTTVCLVIFSDLILASSVFAQGVGIPNPLCSGGGVCIQDFRTLLLRIAWYVGWLIGALSTIMIIWAGILYLTSAGSQERLSKAKSALTWAIVGIAVGISASVISDIVLNILKGQ